MSHCMHTPQSCPCMLPPRLLHIFSVLLSKHQAVIPPLFSSFLFCFPLLLQLFFSSPSVCLFFQYLSSLFFCFTFSSSFSYSFASCFAVILYSSLFPSHVFILLLLSFSCIKSHAQSSVLTSYLVCHSV